MPGITTCFFNVSAVLLFCRILDVVVVGIITWSRDSWFSHDTVDIIWSSLMVSRAVPTLGTPVFLMGGSRGIDANRGLDLTPLTLVTLGGSRTMIVSSGMDDSGVDGVRKLRADMSAFGGLG